MSDFLRLPFFGELENARRILVAGAGGGFDLFCGLPLYFALRNSGKEVFLGNHSFALLGSGTGRRLAPGLVEVTAESWPEQYFPELHLARWFREARGEEIPIYAFRKMGVRPLAQAYETLVDELEVDTVLLIDGGTDSLMAATSRDSARRSKISPASPRPTAWTVRTSSSPASVSASTPFTASAMPISWRRWRSWLAPAPTSAPGA